MLLGLGRNLGRVVFRAHVHDARVDPAGVHERAAQQLVARALFHQLALAGEQALVGVAATFHHLAVGGHLVAAPEHDDVAAYQLVKGKARLDPVAQGGRVAAGHDGEPVGDALGADLLHDADDRVAHDDNHEEHVFERAGEQDEDGQHEVHRVEQRADVLARDVGDAAGLHPGIDVGMSLRRKPRGLGARQPEHIPAGTLVHFHILSSPAHTTRARVWQIDGMRSRCYNGCAGKARKNLQRRAKPG